MTGPGPSRLFRLLLRLFPADHRRDYGDEMLEVFSHRFAARTPGALGWIAAVSEAVGDATTSALQLHAARLARVSLPSIGSLLPTPNVVLRQIRRSPGFSATVVFVIAGAVAVNAAVFAFLRGSLFDPPSWRDPHGVMVVWGSNPVQGQVRDVISGSTYIDLATRSPGLGAIAALHGDGVVLVADDRPVVHDALGVTVDFLDVLGVQPLLGRDFGETERMSGGNPAVIVSHAFWQEELGGDPAALGHTVVIDGETRTIIGVLPADFRFSGPLSFMLPLHDDLLAADARTHYHYHVIARLAPGVTPAEATRASSALFAEIALADARASGWSFLVEPFLGVSVDAIRPVLWLLAGAVALVLAVAAVNLATLFRIRTLERAAELAVRSALGAGRSRLLASLLAETLVLSVAAGLIGVFLASPLLHLLIALAPPAVPIPGSAVMLPTLRASLDAPVQAGALAAAVGAGVLIALPSLLTVVRQGFGGLTHSGARVAEGVRAGWLVSAQIALATVLCVAAGMTLQSAVRMAHADLGVEPDRLLTLYFGDVEARPVAERARYIREVLEKVAQVPGVVRAGSNDYLPFEGEDDFQGIVFPERPAPAPGEGIREEWRRVSEGLFEAGGMRVVRGRGFLPTDYEATPSVVVLSEAFARKHYPGTDPIGRRLTVTSPGYRDVEVVGVVADVLDRGPALPAAPVLYAPYQGAPRGTLALYARTSGNPMDVADAVQEAIWSVDSTQPIMQVLPMGELVRRITAVEKLTGTVVGGLAAVALGLSAVGVFGVAGYSVSSRRRELGVRLALGATSRRLEREVVRATVGRLVWPIALGLTLSLLAARAARTLLPAAAGADPALVAATALTIAAVALLAGWIPARRVARIDPVEVIQREKR